LPESYKRSEGGFTIMPLDADAYAAIARFDAAMQQLDVRYAMVGSVARHLYGEARFGYGDIDFVADLNDSHLEPLSKMFGRPANSILPSPLDSLCGWLSDEQIESERARCMCQADYIWLSHLARSDASPFMCTLPITSLHGGSVYNGHSGT
jgi:hypothetical protein